MANTNVKLGYDPNFFIENQLQNVNNTWDLYAPSINTDADGVIVFSQKVDHSHPILSGIITNNSLHFSIINNFDSPSQNWVSSAVGSVKNTINELSRSAGYYKGLGNSFGVNFENIGEIIDNIEIDEKNKESAGDIKSKLKGVLASASNKLGDQLLTSTDYVKVYKGTDIQHEIPELTSRLIYGVFHARGLDKYSDLQFPDVRDKIKYLNNFFVGRNYALMDAAERSDATGNISEGLNNVLGVQSPPLGYSPTFTLNMSTIEELPGTFTLRYGNYFIPNLLAVGFDFNISNIKVRQGKKSEENYDQNKSFHESYTEVVHTPLYADIAIKLQPCTYISKKLMNTIIEGQAIGDKWDDSILKFVNSDSKSDTNNNGGAGFNKTNTSAVLIPDDSLLGGNVKDAVDSVTTLSRKALGLAQTAKKEADDLCKDAVSKYDEWLKDNSIGDGDKLKDEKEKAVKKQKEAQDEFDRVKKLYETDPAKLAREFSDKNATETSQDPPQN